MANVPAKFAGTTARATHSLPRGGNRPGWINIVKDSDRYPVDSVSGSAYIPTVLASHGFVEKSNVDWMVNASTVDGRVDARALAARLNALVNPSDPIEAARIAWESVKRDWRKEWPAPIRMVPSIHAGSEGERVLGTLITVGAESEDTQAKHRSDIEYAMIVALRDLGVGMGLALATDHDVTIISE